MRHTTLRRRKTDPTAQFATIKNVLLEGDISMVLLLAGLCLLLWSGIAMGLSISDPSGYALLFPQGNGTFWVSNYAVTGIAMWYLVGTKLPPFSSLLVGTWVSIIWTWNVMSHLIVLKPSIATSVVYIITGFLIIHRSARP